MKIKSTYLKIILLFIIGIILCFFCIFFNNYVIVGHNIYNRSSKEVNLDFKNEHFGFDNLQRLSDLTCLTLYNASIDDITTLPTLGNIIEIHCFFSDIRDRDIVEKFPNCVLLDCFRCSYYFTNNEYSNIRFLSLDYCNIFDIKYATKYNNLKELSIRATNYKGKRYVINDDFPLYEQDGTLHLMDTSIFKTFKNVETLSLFQMDILDIYGIIDMDNIQKLYVSKGSINNDKMSTIESSNITIVEI